MSTEEGVFGGFRIAGNEAGIRIAAERLQAIAQASGGAGIQRQNLRGDLVDFVTQKQDFRGHQHIFLFETPAQTVAFTTAAQAVVDKEFLPDEAGLRIEIISPKYIK